MMMAGRLIPFLRKATRLKINNYELWACANEVFRQHGDKAPLHVAERLGEIALAGDAAGIATWKEIARRMDAMAPGPERSQKRRVQPPPVAAFHHCGRLAQCAEAAASAPPDVVIDPDPHPTADQRLSAETWGPHPEFPCCGDNRAVDLRSARIFVEGDAILDAIVRRGAAGHQSPAWPLGGGEIGTQFAVLRLAIPLGRIKRLTAPSPRQPRII